MLSYIKAGRTSPAEFDEALVWTALILLLLGMMMVYSASIATAEASRFTGNQPAYFLTRHAVFLGVSLVAALMAFQVPMSVWQRLSPWLFLLGILLLILVLIPGVGRNVNGAKRWLSLGAGCVILAGLLLSTRTGLGTPMVKAVGWLKSGFGALLRRRTLGSLGLMGLLNGLLPCGLVYAACTGAAATGSLGSGAAYMALFGLGTVPLMLGIGLSGKALPIALRFKLQQLAPLSLAVVGALLVLRGLALGIPYLSPDLAAGTCAHCH